MRYVRSVICLALILGLVGLAHGPAWAQGAAPPAPPAAAPPQVSITQLLDRIERQLADPRLDAAGFDRLRQQLEREREALTRQRTSQREDAQAVQTVLDSLGPVPAPGQPRESSVVAEARRQLTQRLQRTSDLAKESDLALGRIQALMERLGNEARQQFTRQLAYRGAPPFGLEFWRLAAADIAGAWDGAAEQLTHRDAVPPPTLLLQTLLAAGIVGLLGLSLPHLLRRRFGMTASTGHRSLAALTTWLRLGLLPLVVLLAAHVVLASDPWSERGLPGFVVQQTGFAIAWAVLCMAGARALLLPHGPVGAMLQLPADLAARLLARVHLFAWIAILGMPALAVCMVPSAGIGARDVAFAATTVYAALMLLAVTDRRIWLGNGMEPAAGHRRRQLICALALAVSALAMLALLFGYVIAARYVALGALQTLLAAAVFGLVRVGLHDLLRRPDVVHPENEEQEAVNSTWRFTAGLLIDLLLMLLLAALLLLVWGVSLRTLGGYAMDLVYGVTIGSVTVSLIDICAAIAVLAVGVAVTRFISRGLNQRLERQTQVDPGVRNSVVTGVAYIGYVIAALLGVTALGLNLSNLAIIAGALSVGIGFGLQNIVNNFVSGLILLIERPVKVGDWVVVGNREGYVRRINVRSTEIETFPRASVIIPNSELISGVVMNWTHRDKFGRVDVDVTLPYGTNLEKTEALLLRCLCENHEVLPSPPPFVLLRSFGDAGLMLSMRGHIANVERRALVESELRKAVYIACQAEGLMAPQPPKGLHLADIDRIEAALQGLSSARGPAS